MQGLLALIDTEMPWTKNALQVMGWIYLFQVVHFQGDLWTVCANGQLTALKAYITHLEQTVRKNADDTSMACIVHDKDDELRSDLGPRLIPFFCKFVLALTTENDRCAARFGARH